ncbi:MAG TPA: hypothetical protein VIN07_00255 [Flavipsychrobacter sp.]
MKNLSVITVLIVLFLYSCKENPNMVPQTSTSSSPTTLTATYTQHMGKQWLLGGIYTHFHSKNKGGGRPYDTTYRVFADTVYTVRVVSDSVINFMGMDYYYIDTIVYGWGHNVYPDTSERLLFNCDCPSLNYFSYINYYYKQDSFQYYYIAGDVYNTSELKLYSK